MTRGIFGGYPSYIGSCYRDWLKTQGIRAFGKEAPQVSWLNNVPQMHHRRAPGGTCIGSLSRDTLGSTANPINNSKGCGGVMRVAPIGLYLDGERYSSGEIDRIGAEAAALTHGHELGYIPAAALVHIVHMVSHNDETLLEDAIVSAIRAMERLFPTAQYLSDFVAIMEKAIALSKHEISDLDAIRQLGEGWVAEETLAIAVYCALKHQNSFEKAIVAAVNHSGDSDSTGTVTGNILGAHLGIDAIPQKFLTNLELRDIIEDIAKDLFHDCQLSDYDTYSDAVWVSKYITHEYAPK